MEVFMSISIEMARQVATEFITKYFIAMTPNESGLADETNLVWSTADFGNMRNFGIMEFNEGFSEINKQFNTDFCMNSEPWNSHFAKLPTETLLEFVIFIQIAV
jgi:hypothetical protein